MVLFVIGFFTLHFVGFHYGHSFFLHLFFPILEGGREAYGGGLRPFWGLTTTVLRAYWPLVLICAFSRWDAVLRAWKSQGAAIMGTPYLNVLRMHATIFGVAIAAMLGLEGLLLYVVLILQFFPIYGWLRAWRARGRS